MKDELLVMIGVFAETRNFIQKGLETAQEEQNIELQRILVTSQVLLEKTLDECIERITGARIEAFINSK